MSEPKHEETIFAEALRLPPEARAAYLGQAAAGNPVLRRRVESLLNAYEAGGFLEQAAAPELRRTIALSVPLSEKEGDRIGRYKLLQQIGEGGCGVVYMAEQEEPVRRRVALKIIKLGMDTKNVIARFEAERQALAMMDHPNIAKVFDAGATDTGRPYFVMELVRGLKITDYSDEAKLSIRARLELFVQVCHAVQHAHQKGIIHRDLKPSNILVTINDGVPVPKVIDFGIAKATSGQQLTDKTLVTAFEQFIGTPAYMSPEQAIMTSVDIDTRSDIYALGVLVYELLTGKTPFDTRELLALGLDEMRRTIREKEPERPSTRLSTLAGQELSITAQRRGLDAPKLVSELRGDLDWIVMKALEKDRTRRYETANGLARDIQRCLNNEPVVARPPSASYRLRKFVHRNKVMVTSGAAIAAVLVLGALVSTWEAIRATQAAGEQSRLRQAAQTAQINEAQQRQRAEALAYASDMNLAQHALAANNLVRALELLNRHRPRRGQSDLRGWEWRYLWQQCQGDALDTCCQRTNGIRSLAASNDGRWLATVEYEGAVSIWDLRTRRLVASPPAGNFPGFAVFSPRQAILAYSSANGARPKYQDFAVCLWDVAGGRLLRKLPLDNWCCGLAFSADGQRLITATTGLEGRLTVWGIPSGAELATYPAPELPFMSDATTFAATPDLTKAVHQTPRPRNIRLLDLQTGQECWTVEAASEGQHITALAISADGKWVASGADTYTPSSGGPTGPSTADEQQDPNAGYWDVRVWDANSGKLAAGLRAHRNWIAALVFWPDGKTLASASADQTICLWDLTTWRLRATLRGRPGSLALLPDNRTLVTGSSNGSVWFWDSATPRRKRSHLVLSGGLLAWRFAPDNQSVLAVDRQGRVVQWSGADFQSQEVLLDLGRQCAGAYILADARSVAAQFTNGIAEVWDLPTRTLSCRLSGFAKPGQKWSFGWTQARSNRLFVGCWGADSIREWDLATGQELPSWPRPASARCGEISPDGRFCLTFGWDTRAALREIATGRDSNPNLQITDPLDVAFSPDGNLVAAVSMRGWPGDLSPYVKIWDAATFHEVTAFSGSGISVTFSPDGKRLAAGAFGRPEAIKLWDTGTYQELLTLEGATGDVAVSAAFSPDGNIIGARDSALGVVHLWRAPSWAEIEAVERMDTRLERSLKTPADTP